MPQLPVIRPRIPLGTAQLAQVPAGGFGQGIARGIADLADMTQSAVDQQDSLDAKQQAGMLDLNLDLLKEDVKSEPDFAKRDELYQQKSAEYLQNATGQISSPRVKAALNSYYSLKFPREALKFRVENLKDWGQERVAQTDALGDQMANMIVSTNDPQESAKYRGLYMAQLNELSIGPHAPLTARNATRWSRTSTRRLLRASRRAGSAKILPAGSLPRTMTQSFRNCRAMRKRRSKRPPWQPSSVTSA